MEFLGLCMSKVQLLTLRGMLCRNTVFLFQPASHATLPGDLVLLSSLLQTSIEVIGALHLGKPSNEQCYVQDRLVHQRLLRSATKSRIIVTGKILHDINALTVKVVRALDV